MSGCGTKLPIQNVRFHGRYWGLSGRATDIAKTTFMTRSWTVIHPDGKLNTDSLRKDWQVFKETGKIDGDQ